jgi:hypothetical protein
LGFWCGEKWFGMGRRERRWYKRGFQGNKKVGSGIGNADYGGHNISPLLTLNKQWHY